MDANLLTILGIGLVALFFGYFFGLFEGRGQGYKRRRKEEAAEKPAATAAQAPAPAPAAPDKSLLRLSLDGDQRPVLEMDGRRADVARLAPDQRKRLIDLMLVMRPWVEASTPARPSAPPASVPASPAPPPISSEPRRADLAAGSAAVRSSLAGPQSAPVAAAVRPLAAPETPEPNSPNTMVGQIDAILQARLTSTPLANRAVRLTESPEGGVIIWIGLQRYAGLADVPDPEVQAVIKAAIAEWEQKYTPS